MSRTYAHTPSQVVGREQYDEAVYGGPRQDPNNPWHWVPGAEDLGMPDHEISKHHASHPGATAGARQQRRAMRRKRRTEDHMLSRDPERYEDMPTTVEKINRWLLPPT